jgi:uncharacterized protein
MDLFGFIMWFDPNYLLFMLPGMLIGLWATMKVKSTFAKYSQIPSRRGITGAQAARMILDQAALEDYDTASGGEMSTRDVAIEAVGGQLSDHYDPTQRVLRLSEGVYASNSLAALGIAAHEAGHAIQHATGYKPLGMRSALYPLASIGSRAWPFLLMGGIFFGQMAAIRPLLFVGIGLFSFSVLFYVVTLPVEFNASSRAMACLGRYNIITEEEATGAKKVLSAAAMTYVAAVITAVFQLLYLLTLLGGGRDD